jgi:hypothetical protein
MIFPSKVSERKPRRRVDYTAQRKSRDTELFSWWSDPIGRIYIIAGQMSLLHANPDIKAHAQFFGKGEHSIAYRLVVRLRNEHRSTFDSIAAATDVGAFSPLAFTHVVSRFYHRIYKVAYGNKDRTSGRTEHYLTRRNPATKDEIKAATKLVIKI